MEKTKIDWCDSTWNPVTGCLHGCEYCYAREITRRFGKNLPDCSDFASRNKGLHLLDSRIDATPYPFRFEPTFHAYRLNDYINKSGRKIFVCSMADLFGAWVPDNWIEEIFAACKRASQHNYLFLTKNPQRYLNLEIAGKLPKKDNMWYGVTITNMEQVLRAYETIGFLPGGANVFFSIEPLHEDISRHSIWDNMSVNRYMEWVIIGAETGSRIGKIIPRKRWIENIVIDCREAGIPVFMKSSLKDIWGEPLIQEFPKELKGGQQPWIKD